MAILSTHTIWEEGCSAPLAIYIDGEGNRLIGTGCANGPVHIADPTGTLIATRQVDQSYAVTMDKRGMIYLAEYNNKRVSIYY